MEIEEVKRLARKTEEYEEICEDIEAINREVSKSGKDVSVHSVSLGNGTLYPIKVLDKEFVELAKTLFMWYLSRKRDELKKEIDEA